MESDQESRSVIYQALVVYDADQSARVIGRAGLKGNAGGDDIKAFMIDLLVEDDFPHWDPDKIRVVEFLWSDVPCGDDQ